MLINRDLWLTQDLIAELFGTARSTVTEHINNILKEGELSKETSCRNIKGGKQNGKHNRSSFWRFTMSRN